MVKISGLPPIASPDGADPSPIVDDSATTTKKITLTQVKTWLTTQLAYITGAMIASATIKKANVDFTTAGGIWWEELTRATLASDATSLASGTFAAKKYIRIMIHAKLVNTNSLSLRANGDTANNYSDNYSLWDGNANGNDLNTNAVPLYGLTLASGDRVFSILDVVNDTTSVKQFIGRATRSTASAGAGPVAEDVWSKWINVSSQITSLSLFSGANMGAGTQIIVLGHD